jgi:undecaprenyl pyrophosphate synthase
MIVYTTDAPANVRSLQLSVARHQDRMLAALTSGDDGLLCTDCKSLRGALASGKLSPEVVNVERGCMSLYTSPDPDVVQKIHVLTSAQFAAHVKS